MCVFVSFPLPSLACRRSQPPSRTPHLRITNYIQIMYIPLLGRCRSRPSLNTNSTTDFAIFFVFFLPHTHWAVPLTKLYIIHSHPTETADINRFLKINALSTEEREVVYYDTIHPTIQYVRPKAGDFFGRRCAGSFIIVCILLKEKSTDHAHPAAQYTIIPGSARVRVLLVIDTFLFFLPSDM